MKTSHKFIIVSAVLLPALTCILTDSALFIFTATFFMLVACVFAFLFFRLSKRYKLPREKSITIFFISSLCFSGCLGYSQLYQHTAEGIFKRHAMGELPQGIKFIDSKGYVPLGGGSESAVFRMPSVSFSEMIKNSSFKESTLSEIPKMHYHLEEMKSYGLTPAHVYLKSYLPDSPYMSGVLLFVNENKTLFYLYRWKI